MKEQFDSQRVIDTAGHVVVLMGGTSAEREISLLSGKATVASLQRCGVQVTALDVGARVVSELAALNPDFVLNMLHGERGEDGVIQGLLELLDVPYSGSGVLASALAMDKIRAKQIWLQEGLASADFELLTGATDWQAVFARLGTSVVKPVNGGSSLGITKAESAEALREAYLEALKLDAKVMAETCIEGGEYTVTVLNGVVLPIIELQSGGKIYDYDAKYITHNADPICPARLGAEEAAELSQMALHAYAALGCRGTARVDAMRDRDGRFLLLELNTLPGMTEHSFVPLSASVIGIGFDELVLRIIDQALPQVQLGESIHESS